MATRVVRLRRPRGPPGDGPNRSGKFIVDGYIDGNGYLDGNLANRRTGARDPPAGHPRGPSPSSGRSGPHREGPRRHRRPTGSIEEGYLPQVAGDHHRKERGEEGRSHGIEEAAPR